MSQHTDTVFVGSLDDAATDLVEWWSAAAGDPFVSDLLVTPGSGHHRWFSQRLAQAHGVVAGVSTRSLRGLQRELEVSLLDIDARRDPWSATAVASSMLDVFEAQADADWFARVRDHLSPPGVSAADRPARRLATADRLARLLLSYVDRAPDMLRAWGEGRPVDPTGEALTETWQYELYAHLMAAIESPDPLQRRAALLTRLREREHSSQRVAVVTIEALSPFQSELIDALRASREVRHWHLSSVTLDDPAAPLARLAARPLTGAAGVPATPSDPPPHDLPALQRIQQRLWGQQVSPGRAPDPSVQLHASHGLDRQVEVLREVLTGLFDADPSLEPRDVVVICTDLEAAAPLLDAAFGLGEAGHHPGHQLRVQAPGMQSSDNVVLTLLDHVLGLSTSRATAADLVDLCAHPALATRFGFDDDALARLRSLVSRAEVRWGLDTAHRTQAFDLPISQSTWFAGVERLLLGAAMSDAPPVLVDRTAAVSGVDGQDLSVVGALAEVVSRLRKLQHEFATAAPASDWVTRIDEALELLVDLPRDQQWQISAARAAVRSWAASSRSSTAALTRADVREVVARLSRTVRRRPTFGNGNLQVVGLDDLRGVPHRVVAVLGLDDSAFPTRSTRRGDDLVPPHLVPVWDDRRARSQAALLDAVMAARDTLVVTYAHRDARTNDLLDEPVIIADLRRALNDVTTQKWRPRQHTLQPHSAENFRTSRGQQVFSFDRQAYEGAAALTVRLESPPLTPPDPTQWRFPAIDPAEPVALADLIDFWKHPARALLQRVISTSMRRYDDELATELPLELFGLTEHTVGTNLLAAHDAGLGLDESIDLERARGHVPLGELGERPLNGVVGKVRQLVKFSQAEGDLTDVPVTLQVGDSPLTGVVRLTGNALISRSYSRMSGADLLASWVQLLAAVAMTGSSDLEAWIVRRNERVTLAAPSRTEALSLLSWFVTWRRVGLQRVLLAPPNHLLAEASINGPWAHDLPRADVDRRWNASYNRDADWSVFTGAPWHDVVKQPSGVDGLTVGALGAHVFGRISEARR